MLRVHPDRFRSQSPKVRRRNADLVHAMSERMASNDFLAYTCDEGIDSKSSLYTLSHHGTFTYVLEGKDGSILQHEIKLNASVERVLKHMVAALESTGTCSMTPPPPTPSPKSTFGQQHEILWAPHDSSSTTGINHKYDVNSRVGRDLMGFLHNLDFDLVQQRRASRMDVNAVALVARRSFSFQSINGRGLGWSSASFAILLRSLLALYEEHGSKFHVTSFYPLELVWSSEEFESSIDLHGGLVYLNPAHTPIQWLENTFLKITQESLDTFATNQFQFTENRNKVQGAFGGVKFQKGHSCCHYDYHEFLARLAESPLCNLENARKNKNTTALTLESIVVIVEASCRRAVLTPEGMIRVGASMEETAIARAISKLSLEATKRVKEEAERRQKCRETIDQAQWELGLQKVYRATKLVKSDQMVECLVRLLAMDQREQLKRNLAGNSLGIAVSGQFCHLGDDGSVVIPWDWR